MRERARDAIERMGRAHHIEPALEFIDLRAQIHNEVNLVLCSGWHEISQLHDAVTKLLAPANARLQVGIVPAGGGETRWLDLGEEPDFYIARAGWTAG